MTIRNVKFKFVPANKVLLAHSHAHLRTYGLWLLSN